MIKVNVKLPISQSPLQELENLLSDHFGRTPSVRHNQYYYIRMKTEEPGVVTMRTGVGCPEVKVTVAMNCDHIPYQRQQIV
ncbi:hypothetical protein DPMN_016811 [Dreissena polymorpha]|uniref:Uncharacterized protein n=1 Tax=Dreissena polymorpha TaxID=45954 RepID=A0A9D4NDJ9_DREPO|nr:hypothetical protein DPMN_016811 [Dreissena polymorpha]